MLMQPCLCYNLLAIRHCCWCLFKMQFFVICILQVNYTNQMQVIHGKKAANSLEFAAFLRNQPFFY